MTSQRDINESALWIVRGLMAASGTALATGLLLYLGGDVANAGAPVLLRLGLTLLMSIPAVRVSAVIVERFWNRDYQMVVMTAIVLLELAIVVVLALKRV